MIEPAGQWVGRFMSPDDGSDQDINNPQSWNLYAYGRNGPTNNTDPDGHAAQDYQQIGAGLSCFGNPFENGDYEKAASGDNGGLNVPTLDQLGNSKDANGNFVPLAITDANGNIVGTATYMPTNPGIDYYVGNNAQGYNLVVATYHVVNIGTAAYASIYAAAACAHRVPWRSGSRSL